MLLYLTVIAFASCLPLAIGGALYIRSRGTRYAYQEFNDGVKALGGQITLPSFILFLPALFLILFEGPDSIAPLPWEKKETILIIGLWLLQYPVTLLVYHTLKAGLQKSDPYAPPYKAIPNIGVDLLKHGFLLLLFFAAMYAGNQTLDPQKIGMIKQSIENLVSGIHV